jgi:NAD(P)-dependent dehydrogenase (short-subunit alcohol dehydrogenase family)
MATTVISGGTDGIGRAVAAHQLRHGHTVVVIGRDRAKFDALARQAGGSAKAHFIRADLRLARENLRVVAEIKERFPVVDTLVLAAAYVHRTRVLTEENFEHTFALYYLSRHLLAAGLLDVFTGSERPLILDTTVPGAPRNAVHWDDLQLEHRFTWKAANRQSRRMGQLSGLRLVTATDRIRYVLYNPGFVRTSHQGALGKTSRRLVGLLAKALATDPEKAIRPIVDLIADPPSEPLSAFMKSKQLTLSTDDTDRAEADRLHTQTQFLLASLHSA